MNQKYNIATDVEAVITSFQQGTMILEAVQSLCAQTTLPNKITIVDDGSTDQASLDVLKNIQADLHAPVPIVVHYKENGGVSSARNVGIRNSRSALVLVLDGDDKLEPTYIECVSQLLREHTSMVAASSWLHTFGVLDAIVCPSGGDLLPFLSRNCCPATHILRREVFEQCGRYDETMRSGFEDWDFFLSILETSPEAHIGIVERPLIWYRTNPVSANVKSMNKRLELMHFIIKKHIRSYRDHVSEALLGIEAVSNARLYAWEEEMLHSIKNKNTLSETSEQFLRTPSYGDGGMACAIRIASHS